MTVEARSGSSSSARAWRACRPPCAARAGLARSDHADRRRAPPAVRPAAAVQGRAARQGRRAPPSTSTSRRSASSCGSAASVTGLRAAERTCWTPSAGPSRTTPGHRHRRRARSRCPAARASPASICCAPSTTPRGCGPCWPRQRRHRGRRRGLDRRGVRHGRARGGLRGHRRRGRRPAAAPARCPPRSPRRWPPGTRRAAPSCVTGARVARVEPGRGAARRRHAAARRRRRRRHRRPARDRLAGRLGHRARPRTARSRRRAAAHLRCPTSTPSATAPPSPPRRYGERLLVHHWDNALQGPRTVAAEHRRRGRDGEPRRSTTRCRTSGPSSSAASSSTRATTAPPTTLVWRGDPARRRLVGVLAARGPAGRAAGRRPAPRPGAGAQARSSAGTPLDRGRGRPTRPCR